jgi:GxxExxY protein
MQELTKKYLDEGTYPMEDAAIEVHKEMGRGLLESVCHQCMMEELGFRKINFHTKMKIPVLYKTKELRIEFRCDLFVENCLMVELKVVSEIVA